MNIRDGKSEHHEHLAFGAKTSAMSNARERSAHSEATPGTSGAFPSVSRFWSTSAFTVGSQPYARALPARVDAHRKLDAVKRRYLSEREVERLMAGFCSRPV